MARCPTYSANGWQFNGAAKLLVYLAVILVAVAAGWGVVKRQVTDNTKDIAEIRTVDIVGIEEAKLDKEVFGMYIEQRQKASEKTDKTLEKIDGKLDRLIAGGS